MAKYRRKPTVVEAEQFFPDVKPWPDAVWVTYPQGCQNDVTTHEHWVSTVNGRVRVKAGDWILTDTLGFPYPCDPRQFAATYEPAREAETTEDLPSYATQHVTRRRDAPKAETPDGAP